VREEEEEEQEVRQKMKRRRPRASSTFAVIMLTAVTLAAVATSPAAAKKKKPANPLAGKWVGETAFKPGVDYPGPYAPLSYRITRAGRVLDFSTSVTTNKTPSGDPCPTPIFVTVLAPPTHLTTPVPGFPKGKKFTLSGTSNGSPPAQVSGTGAIAPPYSKARNMTGLMVVGQGGIVVGPNVTCRTGVVYWRARRVGK
jgi:hypothetical protein